MATGRFRNLNNPQYWHERTLYLMEQKWNELKPVEKEIKKHYRLAQKDIQDDLHAFYSRYADENGLSYNDAMKQLNAYEIGDYGARMQALQRQFRELNSPFAQAEIERLVRQGQLQRLSALLAQVDARLIELGHSEQMDIFTPWLSTVYESTYYATGYMLAKGTGVGMSFTRLNHRAVTEAIHYPWSGMMFSERIWKNRTNLVHELRQTITNGLIRGSSVQKMSREIAKKMDSSYKNSLRLIRTETTEVLTSSSARGYEEYGLEEYQFLATLDNRTSSTCRNLDLQIFKLKDKQAGVNAPPAHPSCRSSIAPRFEGINLIGRRARVGGQSVIVPGDINYNDWHRKYVQGISTD